MSKQITITLSDSTLADIRECQGHQRTKTNVEFFCTDAIEKYTSNMLYRYGRNVKKNAEHKELKQTNAQLQAQIEELLKQRAAKLAADNSEIEDVDDEGEIVARD